MKAIAESGGFSAVELEQHAQHTQQPLVLRGLVSDWPLVRKAQQGDLALANALQAMDSGEPADALLLSAQHQGRIFYGDSGEGFNYVRKPITLSQALEQILRYAQFDRAPALALQSAAAARCAPSFMEGHRMPLLPATVQPRLWLGTAIQTPTHFDESHNVACVVAGRRRFLLFPPDQIGNLSIGPIGNAPTGTPISLVDPDQPDLAQHPRFAAALQQAQVAVLEPGDAIYIPPLWWHHVSSLARVNLLANYWWKTPAESPSAMNALLHALLALRELPSAQRRAWQSVFAHWVFEADPTTTAHLPEALQGVHGKLTPALREQLRQFLLQGLEAGLPPAP